MCDKHILILLCAHIIYNKLFARDYSRKGCATEKAAQHQLATEATVNQKAVEEVKQRAAAAISVETSMNQKESEDDTAITAVGSKRSRMTRSPYRNATASQVQDGLTVSPQQKINM